MKTNTADSSKRERRLLIDDQRTESDLHNMGLPCRVDIIARNYKEGFNQLYWNGPWDVLYLDHDLHSYEEDGTERTGYHLICDIEKMIKGEMTLANSQCIPKKIICVSDNPPGRKQIQQVIDSLDLT